MRKWLPVVIIIGMQMHRIVTRPVLNSVLLRVRRAPMDPDGVYLFWRAEIDDDPLWMRVFGLAGEMRVQIRIAFPKRFIVAIGNSRITIVVCLVDCVSAPRQAIAIRQINWCGQ